MTITEDEIDYYVDTLTNTITSAIAEKELYWFANRNQGTDTPEETPEETLAKDQNTAVQDKR